uniref:Dynein regulatory complex subunit 2 n=1 Tax=Mus spicilegus TaxID=10103 RepID=A0A8C6G6Z1_MUSSI
TNILSPVCPGKTSFDITSFLKKLEVPTCGEEEVVITNVTIRPGREQRTDKLAKEEHNSALNLNKINTQWRTILRELKTRELHKDIEILSQTFERVVDCKDSVIKVCILSGVVAHAFYPSTREAEAGGFLSSRPA